MNSSAEKSSRKLNIGALDRRRAAMVTAAALILSIAAGPVMAREARPMPPLDLFAGKPKLRGTLRHVAIPLPRPRPAEAHTAEEPEAAEKPSPGEPGKTAEPAPPQPSPCRLALTEEIAIAPSVADLRAPGGSGRAALVRPERQRLP